MDRTGRRELRFRFSAGLLLLPLLAAVLLAADKYSWPDRISRACQTITARECFAHVSTLASDEYEGRLAGSAGGRLASTYIAREFKEMGLKPGGIDGSYFQPFPLPSGTEKEGPLSETTSRAAIQLKGLSNLVRRRRGVHKRHTVTAAPTKPNGPNAPQRGVESRHRGGASGNDRSNRG